MYIPLKTIVAGVRGSLTKGLRHVIYALDDEGRMWAYDRKTRVWELIDGPTEGSDKQAPDEPTDEIKPWHKL